MRSDTIAAISTAAAEGGIGIIRISGPEAVAIADRIFMHGKNSPDASKDREGYLSGCPTHTIHYGFIMDKCEPVDEVLVSVMRAPRTYTAEDIVEINCHGGICAMQQVLRTVLSHGARTAEPGEFTKRAFLNGRIDLSRAEAVLDVIQSKNRYALSNSVRQVRGQLFRKIQENREIILTWMAEIEAGLDDPEHIPLEGFSDRIRPDVENSRILLQKMRDSFYEGRLIREGIRTAIVGKPNAGKSSLLNLLLGQERAIVTDIAGTTRDILQESVNIDGITLHMADTAGIRESDDIIEQIGVEKAKEQLENADLVLFVTDASRPVSEDDEQILHLMEKKNVIVLLNKTDLPVQTEIEAVAGLLRSHGLSGEIPVISFSAKTGTGLDELKQEIRNRFFNGSIHYENELLVTNARQAEALGEAVTALEEVLSGIDNGMPEDFLSIDMRAACDALGLITGESVGEDLADMIFSRFCMGK